MTSRRGLLIGSIAIGLGGAAYVTDEDVKRRVDKVTQGGVGGLSGPPPTDNMVGSVEGPKQGAINSEGEIEEEYASLVKKVDFYESGAAKIHPTTDHSCYEALAFKHEATNLPRGSDGTLDTSEALTSWSFGDFDEVLTVDMAGAINNKGNYPSSNFELIMISNDGVCLTAGVRDEVDLKVPDSFMP